MSENMNSNPNTTSVTDKKAQDYRSCAFSIPRRSGKLQIDLNSQGLELWKKWTYCSLANHKRAVQKETFGL